MFAIRSRSAPRRAGFALLLALIAAPAAAQQWERVEWGSGVPSAVAVDATGVRVAVGNAGGVDLREGGAPARRIARTGPVRDLAFAEDGVLWIAAEDGLWRVDASGRVEDRSPAPGAAAGDARRVVVLGQVVAVSTRGGVHLSSDGQQWIRVAVPVERVDALGLRAPRPDELELWLAEVGGAWCARFTLDSGVPQLRDLRQESIPHAPTRAAPSDLIVDLDLEFDRDGDSAGVGTAVAILYPSALALRDAGQDASWTVWRPVLPAGSVAQRLRVADGRLWIGTDRGLLVSDDARAGWHRAAPPAATAPVAALAASGRAILAVGERGVLRAELAQPAARVVAAFGNPAAASRPNELSPDVPSSNVSQLSAPSLDVPSPDTPQPGAPSLDVPSPDAPQRDVLSFNVPSGDSGPSLAEVRAMALRHLGLEASRARSLRERAASRGWAPRVAMHLDYGEGRDRSRDYDEAFLSGETRFLFDRDEDHSRDWDVGLVLRWDLGNARFDPEELDAAREERQWIALRDDVLDELVQLYFERQRKLLEAARVAAGPGDTRAQVAQLRLRARELAAGLDSWTGGGFSRALASRRSVSGAVGGSEAK